MSRMARGSIIAPALALLLGASGCHWLDQVADDIGDHLRSCHDATVRLVNDEQTLGPVSIIAPGEGAAPENLLQSGQSRKITMCLNLGDSYGFRAIASDQVLGIANCPASLAHYDTIDLQVRWTPVGFRCVNW
jgi:hypothetical protein